MDLEKSSVDYVDFSSRKPRWPAVSRVRVKALAIATLLLVIVTYVFWSATRSNFPPAWDTEAYPATFLVASPSRYNLQVIAYYRPDILEACPGGISVATSLDNFRSGTVLVPLTNGSYVLSKTIAYEPKDVGKTVELKFALNDGLYEEFVPDLCWKLCPRFSSAGQQSWGMKTSVLLPSDGSGATAEAWPSFCQSDPVVFTDTLKSKYANRSFTITTYVPPMLFENRSPRPLSKMPSIVIKLDGQFFFPNIIGNGNTLLLMQSMIGSMKDVIIIDVDFSINSNPMWRHPVLADQSLELCAHSAPLLNFWPSVNNSWSWYYPSYLKINGTYGFGKLDSLLQFFSEEMLPFVVSTYFPHSATESPIHAEDLEVAVWGISDAGYAAWHAVWSNPKMFDIAMMQSPFLLWNCGHALNTVLEHGNTWVKENPRQGPRFYVDFGDHEDLRAYGTPASIMFQVLQGFGMQLDRDLLLHKSIGDGHFGNAFYSRTPRMFLSLFAPPSSLKVESPLKSESLSRKSEI